MKCFAFVFCLASAVLAQPVRADDARANALLDRGASLRERGRLADALDAFMHADAIESTPRSIAQIGLTHGALEHWVQAYDYLRRALLAEDDAWIRSRWRSLEAAMLDVRAHVGFIRIAGEREGVHIVIGTRDLGPLPIAEAVAAAPGLVEVEVRRGDEVLFTQRLTLTPGEVEDVTIQPDAPLVAMPPAPAEAAVPVADPLPAPERASGNNSNPWPVIGWTSIGVGGALVIGGVIFHVMREHEAGLANDCRTNPSSCMGTAEEHVDAASTDRTLAIIGYASGGALVVGGVLALLLGPTHTSDDGSSAHLVCAPTLTNVGASCVGNF